MNISILDYNQKLITRQIEEIFRFANKKEIVFVCVGNYKVWFDCFSSIIATYLRQNKNNKYFVYGGSDFPIIADNLCTFMDFIARVHPSAFVIVVDNCLTLNKSQNCTLEIKNSPAVPAGFVSNKSFGNASILLKTYIFDSPLTFLHKQNDVINILLEIIENGLKNCLICQKVQNLCKISHI
jgi:putative sporulation protein YyaC